MGFMQNLNSNMDAISKHGIIGSDWFEDENERAQTVNTERYVTVLDFTRTKQRDWLWWTMVPAGQVNFTHQIAPLTDWESDFGKGWSAGSVTFVGTSFTRLKPPDLYLWEYLKDNMYPNNPQTIAELKAAIANCNKIWSIPREECLWVIDNFAERMQVCLLTPGCDLEHILNRTYHLCKVS